MVKASDIATSPFQWRSTISNFTIDPSWGLFCSADDFFVDNIEPTNLPSEPVRIDFINGFYDGIIQRNPDYDLYLDYSQNEPLCCPWKKNIDWFEQGKTAYEMGQDFAETIELGQ